MCGTKMPNRLISKPAGQDFAGTNFPEEPLELFASATLNGGMVTQLDAADIQPNQLTLAINANCRYDVISRRFGFNLLAPVKPNTKKVLAFTSFKDSDGNIALYRFDRNGVWLKAGAWTGLGGAALTATDANVITFLSINDRAFFSNQADPLQEINVVANTYAQAGNSKTYKYYCSFGNRIVGANLLAITNSPIEVGWSGDFNFDEWDPFVDFSAGFTPLVDNPSDFSDDITGIFGFANALLVMRERSVWLGTKQPSATNPFYFYTAVPEIGCDAPNSIAKIPNGVAWYDRRLNNVYAYTLGMAEPLPIGDAIRKTLVAQVIDKTKLFSGYDSVNSEYILAIPIASSNIVRLWKFNFKVQAWTYSEIKFVSCVSPLDYTQASGKINDLIGKINELVGKIDDLSPSVNEPALFLGLTTGDILQESTAVDTDNGVVQQTTLNSKLFKLPVTNANVAQLHIEYRPILSGSFTINYSKDNGVTFKPYKSVTFSSTDQSKRLTIVCNKNVRCKTFMWQIVSTEGAFDVLEYSAFVFPVAGYTRSKTT